ncbi:uncharacterized protein MONOS_4886 [Monocercomonoides exilis]|uniref:uncharacterized protein n=1 Tax=Monocercomonoides exilis TaxID=2049356 RepID=UPI00355A5DAF|nr:hypothetical protein MONOS_4886 [Monocercomonoides exilis]|eukprot:MONOS_4886.1-p1 / transcript=MONOS_4886.1 / gene=MONOS_4886 / organism=Monocercomonoides_exilis_PA203 / gene_product=unspecified product / transcript_product=unspecified product / location=Mono_scaffold00136:65007-67586(-) / protein_length=860 / sequence_SO=supercontig / SO=protein_coding / is_pseudo=false
MFWGLILFQIVLSVYSQDDPSQPVTTVFVKQSGNNSNSGLDIGQERQSLFLAYILLSDETECCMKIVEDAKPFPAEVFTVNKKTRITLEGWKSDGSGNTEVAMDCEVHQSSDLFNCNCPVEFKYLAFHIPITLDNEASPSGFSLALINAQRTSLTISNCKFIRPADGSVVDCRLVYQYQGSLTMDSVECADKENTFTTKRELLVTYECETVILSNFTLKKIDLIADSNGVKHAEAVVDMNVDMEGIKGDLKLNGSTFSEINGFRMALAFKTGNEESTFAVGDGGVTTFSSFHTDFDYSSALYLRMKAITSASQIKWPENGKNLIFDKCTVGEGQSKRNTGLLLYMASGSLFEDIAAEMKKSFAADYTRNDNLWNVAAYIDKPEKFYDFVLLYLDQSGKLFVKNEGKGDGLTSSSPLSLLKEAFDKLDEVLCSEGYFIEIVKDESQFTAEEMTISNEKGITIEGVNSNGNGNAEVSIDCAVSASSALFTCEQKVEFKYLAFNFPTSEKKWNSLIYGNEKSASLTISNCKFVRIGAQSPEKMTINADGDESMEGCLVSVVGGKAEMHTVSCTDERNTVSFSSSLFSFSSVSSASLNGVEISNVNVQNGAAIAIKNGGSTPSAVSIEGLSMNGVNSENGKVAGLEISLSSEESTVEIGRTSKCTFKSCTAPNGKAGAISIGMPKATSNLQLPSANNLEIDGSNTAGSKSSSLFIIAPDFDEFCKKDGTFEFAKDFDESAAGWIMGAENEVSEPADVYEKYLKEKEDPTPGPTPGPTPEDPTPEDPTPEDPIPEGPTPEGKKKPNAGTVVAIVVPIVVVVVVAVVVVVVVLMIVKKRKAKSNKDGEKEGSKDENKEIEMSTQE